MKVRISISGPEAEIELVPETGIDRDLLNAAVGTNQEAKVRHNGTTVFTLAVAQIPIGRAVLKQDNSDSLDK